MYLVLYVNEVPNVIDANRQIAEEPSANQIHSELEIKESTAVEEDGKRGESSLIYFFRKEIPKLAKKVLLVLMKRRAGMKRTIIWLLLLSNFLFVGCEYGKNRQFFGSNYFDLTFPFNLFPAIESSLLLLSG